MLTRLPAALLTTALLAAGTLLAASPAAAQTCYEYTDADGNVEVTCYDDGGGSDDGGEGGGGGGGDGGDGGGGDGGDDGSGLSSAACVTSWGQEVSCVTEMGYWTGSCWAQAMDPQPDPDHMAWGGREDGVILECSLFEEGTDTWAQAFTYWAPSAPGELANPRQLADEAVAAMNLTMGDIGTAPPSIDQNPDAMGLVGLSIWLWVADPAENTTGPITRSAAEGSVSVTATATLDRIEYTLRPRIGSVAVTCAGDNAAGTPYLEAYGEQNPHCGFTAAQNVRMGEPALITGTAHWVVQWAGGGQSGTIEVPPQSSTTRVNIGELHVLRTG